MAIHVLHEVSAQPIQPHRCRKKGPEGHRPEETHGVQGRLHGQGKLVSTVDNKTRRGGAHSEHP